MLQDRFNPLFVFEIRRMVRNRAILVSFCVYLALLLCVAGFVLFSHLSSGLQPGVDVAVGKDLVTSVLMLLYHFNAFVVLFFSLSTTAWEGLVDDMFFTTPLTPLRMLRGKLQTSVTLSFLFFSVTLPMLVLAWMLRGVDLLPAAGSMVVVFLATQVLVAFLCSASFRCRGYGDLFACFLGLAIAAFPLLIGWEACCMSLFYFEDPFVTREIATVLLIVFLMFLTGGILFGASGEMIKFMARSPSAFERFCVTLYAVGFSLLISVALGGMVCVTVFLIAAATGLF